MAKRLLRRYGWYALTILFLLSVSGGLLLLPSARGDRIAVSTQEPAFDTDLYDRLLAGLVSDETELVARYRSDYVKLHALMPPAEDWFLVMEGGIVPYDTSFPETRILDELTPMTELGIPCRSVVVWPDPLTRETVLYDELTLREVAAIPSDWGFSPLDLIVKAWGEEVLYGVDRSWVLSAYSPSRMAFRYTLVARDDLDDLVTEYSRLADTTALKSRVPMSTPMMMKSSSSSMEISAIEDTASGMQITIDLPSGWSGTNDIDVFRTSDLVSYWWYLLGTTNGSNSVTYTDTGSGDSDIALRFYRAADGETDTDSDGYVDGRELLMYHSDPDDEDSYPVTVAGSVIHSNTPQAGTIHVVAVTASNSWDLGRSDALSTPGSLEIEGVPNLQTYWIKAWRDWCDNGEVDPWEATGTATNGPIYLTNSVSNIVVTLTDPPASISGTLSYTGKQSGTWIAMVTTVSTSWTAAVSAEAGQGGFYHLSSLSQTGYYVKAWQDADADDVFDADREASGTWTNNPISLSNSVWDIDFELTDVNADGDGMPDWWELENFGNTNQTDSGDYDGDQMPNLWEYTWDFCPTNADDAMQDYDGDRYFNVYEYKHDTDPHTVGSVPVPNGSGGDAQTPSPTVTVVTNGISIQVALDQATNAYDIVVVEAGTYSITNDIDFPTNTVMLISDEGASATILSGTHSRLVEFSGSAIGSHTALQGFTLTGGAATDGAGIRCDNGAGPTIVSCVVSNCAAGDDGGGLFCDASSPELRDCVFIDNSAADDGGGVRCKDGSAAIFTNCWVTGNTAADDGGGMYYTSSSGMVLSCSISTNTASKDGGGVYSKASAPAFVACYLLGNLAQDDGGGIGCTNDSLTVTGSTISDNTAYDHGGAFYGNNSAAVLDGCVIDDNTAVDGGGLGFNLSTVTVSRCVVVDNWAHVDGGGIRAKDSTPTVRGCLIARNRAFGHGGGVQAKGSTCTVALESCTVADNESRLSGGGVSATDSATASATNTIVWGNATDQLSGVSGLSHVCIQGGATGTRIVTNAPAMTPYWFRLKTGSSCTNAGTNAMWMTSAYDIDGECRITNTIVDIGSDELADSDADGMGDAWERYYFGDLARDGTGDYDGDGLDDADEYAYDGDPTATDTDGDGFDDGDEVEALVSPTSATPTNAVQLLFGVGDTLGGSKSERYVLAFSSNGVAVCTLTNAFSNLWWSSAWFTMGECYDITLTHPTGAEYSAYASYPPPDYDHETYIGRCVSDLVPTGGTNGAHDDWVFSDGFVIYDPTNFLGGHYYDGHTTNFVADGTNARLYILLADIDVDIDGDGVFASTDDLQEAVSPGKFVQVNCDDDNTNGVLDYLETVAETNETDLVQMSVHIGPTNLSVGEVVLAIASGTNRVNIWTHPEKGSGNLLLGTNGLSSTNWIVGTGGDIDALGDFPYTNFWIEGITNSLTNGDVEVEFRYNDTNGITRCVDTNVLTIIRVDVKKPTGDPNSTNNASSAWLSSPCYHWDFQGVATSCPTNYALDVEGEILPAGFTYAWTTDTATAVGTLTGTGATPTHNPPSTASEDGDQGTFKLDGIDGTTATGCTNQTDVIIYLDHLGRDKKKFGTSQACTNTTWSTPFGSISMSGWNCHGSTLHHYSGSGSGSAAPSGIAFITNTWTLQTNVVVTHQSGGGGSHPPLGSLNRGDVVIYFQGNGPMMHSQTCTGGGTETYGANNEPLSYPGYPVVNESWTWAASTAGDWAKDLWLPGTGVMPVSIRVYKKP